MAEALVVDRKGLARKLANRPKAFILYELLQNAWDEDVTEVRVTAHMLPGRPVCQISVEDDSPEGFKDLSSVYTMFKDSKKAADPTKRGRFEIGEKLVLALALRAEVSSTKGTICFEGDHRSTLPARRSKGTVFEGEFRMTREEFGALTDAVHLLSVPSNVATYFNGELLEPREALNHFETTLQTIRVDADGNLSPTQRKTDVKIYPVREGETAHIFEMGIPIIETGDLWHYDVGQRVPMNWERNNVPPSYLQALRVGVLNAMHEKVDKEEATQQWVTEALSDDRCAGDTTRAILDQRFGAKRVIFDPSDLEGNKLAASKGYTVIPGGSLSSGAWNNVRRFGAALPAGQVTPSPKVYDPDGRPEVVIPREDWSEDMHRMTKFSAGLFEALGFGSLEVVIVREPLVGWVANYGGHRLCLNYGRLGRSWFEREKTDPEVLSLLIHEFGHHFSSDHLSSQYHDGLCEIGAKMTLLALRGEGLLK